MCTTQPAIDTAQIKPKMGTDPSLFSNLTQVWYPKIIFSIFFAVLSFKPIVFQQKYVSEIPEIEL